MIRSMKQGKNPCFVFLFVFLVIKMEIKRISLKDIIPNPNNPRKNDKAVNEVVKSIQELGYIAPIIIDENNVVLAGHTRLKAMKKLEYKEVECVVKRGLTEEQKQKYVILDNKLNELADWDFKLLDEQLNMLDFENYNIDFSINDTELKKQDKEYYDEYKKQDEDFIDGAYVKRADVYENQIERFHNIQLANYKGVGKYQMPEMRAEEPIKSNTILLFNRANTYKGDYSKIGMAFWIHDYGFEGVWSNPSKYIDIFRKFEYIISPDFSDYADAPIPIRLYNQYRNRWLGRFYQDQGIKVIPNIRFTNNDSLEWCTEGIPHNAPIAVSIKSMSKDEYWKNEFIRLYKIVIDELKPSVIYWNGVIVEELTSDNRVIILNNIMNGEVF